MVLSPWQDVGLHINTLRSNHTKPQIPMVGSGVPENTASVEVSGSHLQSGPWHEGDRK